MSKRETSASVIATNRTEVTLLEEAVSRAQEGRTQFVLISGDAGTGKTALAKHVSTSIGPENSLSLFAQTRGTRRHSPYFAIGQILDGITKNLEGKSSKTSSTAQQAADPYVLNPWALNLASPNGDASRYGLGSAENRYAYHLALRRVLLAVADHHRITAIVIDDLHLADAATLQALEFVAANVKQSRIIFVVTFDAQCTSTVLRAATTSMQVFSDCRELQLQPPVENDEGYYPSDQLRDGAGSSRALLGDLIDRTPTRALKILQCGSCIGSDFSVARLSQALCLSHLAVVDGLRLVDPLLASQVGEVWRFRHNGIQQAVYASIPQQAKQVYHARVGKNLLDGIGDGATDEDIFGAAEHFYVAAGEGPSLVGQERIAEIYLLAGSRAKRGGAYEDASRYIGAGLALRGAEFFSASAAMELAECRAWCGDIAGADLAFSAVETAATSRLERAKVQVIRAHIFAATDNLDLSLQAGLHGLELLNAGLPRTPSPQDVERALRTFEDKALWSMDKMLQKRSGEFSEPLAVLHLLAAIFRAAYYTDYSLLQIVRTRLVAAAVEVGRTKFTPLACILCAVHLAARREDILLASAYGSAAVQIERELNDVYAGSSVSLRYCIYVMHFRYSIAEVMAMLYDATSKPVGMVDASWRRFARLHILFVKGIFGSSLFEMLEEARSAEAEALQEGSRSQAAAVQLLAEAMTIILKPTTVLRKTSSQPSEDLPRVGKAWLKYCFVMRLVAAYVEGDVQKAFELGAEVHRRVWHTTEIYTPANVVQGQAALFHGLVLAGRKAPSSPREASHRRHLLRLYLRELTWWNQASRENFRGDYLLLLGEVARAGGRYNRARRYLAMAAKFFGEKGFVGKQAIAWELCARCFHPLERVEDVTQCLGRAAAAFRLWGAVNKAGKLEGELNTSTWRALHALKPAHQPSEWLSSAPRDLRNVLNESAEGMPVKLVSTMATTMGVAAVVLALRNDQHNALVCDSRQFKGLTGGQSIQKLSSQWFPLTRGKVLIGSVTVAERSRNDHTWESIAQYVDVMALPVAVAWEAECRQKNLFSQVVHQTRDLEAAHQRLRQLERVSVEGQMAGGFAHEIQNALSGAALLAPAAANDSASPAQRALREAPEHLMALNLDVRGAAAQQRGRDLSGHVRALADNLVCLEDALEFQSKAIGRGLRITENLLSYAKIGREGASAKSVDLEAVLHSVVREARVLAGGEIDIVLAPMTSLFVSSSEEHCYSIFKELVINACYAVQQAAAKRRGHIVLSARRWGDAASVQVKDNGIGIRSDRLAKIFRPFYSTKGCHGTGLGLAQTDKLVRLHGGRITCDSREGEGTRFQR